MNKTELMDYITNNYGIQPDYPWVKYPDFAVFRHQNNRKWFALFMDVSKKHLGLHEEGNLQVVNLKCDPILLGCLLQEKGFFPAYHMNKDNWITVALDGSVEEGKLAMLLDVSFKATASKVCKKQM